MAYKNRNVNDLAESLYPKNSEEYNNYINTHQEMGIPSIIAFDNSVDYEFERLWKRRNVEKAQATIEYINENGQTDYKRIGLVFEKHKKSWFLASDLFVYDFERALPPINNDPPERNPLSISDPNINHYDVQENDFIQWGSFNQATNLLSLSFPVNYKDFEPHWFANNKKLYHIEIDPSNPYFTSLDGVVYNKDMTKLIYYPRGKISAEGSPNGEFTVPDTVKIIGKEAFYNNSGLKKVILSPSVRYLYQDSFHFSANLEEIILNEGLLKIGKGAFTFNPKLSSVTIPSSVIEIGYNCFFNSAKLSSVEFSQPSKLESLGQGAFSNCMKLTEINLPNSLERIENWTFDNCSSLKQLSLPADLNYIGVAAFDNCSLLQTLFIPSQISSIKRKAFHNCDNLELFVEASQKPPGWDDEWGLGLPKDPVWNAQPSA
ncbi:MAG: leucine-rich repeat domain-containing protein [Bacillota bacterium]